MRTECGASTLALQGQYNPQWTRFCPAAQQERWVRTTLKRADFFLRRTSRRIYLWDGRFSTDPARDTESDNQYTGRNDFHRTGIPDPHCQCDIGRRLHTGLCIRRGSGIDLNQLDQLFEPFLIQKKQGSGLGPAISFRIVRTHYGTIEAWNNEQAGATFLFRTSQVKDVISARHQD